MEIEAMDYIDWDEGREMEPECECRFRGDTADASECPLHGALARKWDVRVVYDPPPVPTKQFDYRAWSAEEPEWPMQFGRTAREAHESMIEFIEERIY